MQEQILKSLEQIANNIDNIDIPDVSWNGLNIGFSDEAHNLLWACFQQIADNQEKTNEALNRIATALENK